MNDTDKNILEGIIRLTDQFSRPLREVQNSLQSFQETTTEAANTIGGLQRIMDKIKPLMLVVKDKASRVVQKVKGLLQRVTGRHWDTIVRAKDNATRIISKVKGVLQTVTGKAWSAMLKAQDKISPIVGKVKGILKSITGKAWSALVKVKDMATSVLSKIKGILVGLAAGVTIGVKVALQGLAEEENNKITIDRVLKNAGLKDYKKVGEEYYKYLEDYANTTPFTTAEMATAGTKAMMMAKGDTDQAKQILDMIANTKAFVGDNRTMEEVIDAYFSAKNGNMESLNNILGENFTSFEDAQKQVLDKYGGLVEEQSKTLGGLLSTIKGKIAVNLKDMAAPFKDFISSGMTNFITFLDDVKPKLDAFAQKVADGFKAFSESETARTLLGNFKNLAEFVFNAIKDVIDAVSPTIKDIFEWIGEHIESNEDALNSLGELWSDFWEAAGPIIETAWEVIKVVLETMFDAIDKVLGVVESLVGAFEALGEAFSSGDVQNALSNSNAANGNNTYQSTQPTQNSAFGTSYVPRDNMIYNLHQGEAVLARRDADKWRKGQDKPQIVNNFYGMTIREEADINKITAGIVRKINQQRIITT